MRDPEEHAFFDAIAAAPDDRLVRQVYADWLEEHGNEKRARYIRLACQRAELEESLVPNRDLEYQIDHQMREMGHPNFGYPHDTSWLIKGPEGVGKWWGDYTHTELGMPFGCGYLDRFLTHGGNTSPPFRYLDIVENDAPSDVRRLADCPHLADLTDLCVRNRPVGDELKEVLRSPHAKNLQKLTLIDCQLAPDFVDVFCEPSACRNLKYLAFSSRRMGLGDGGLAKLLASAVCPRLGTLVFSYTLLSAADVAALAACPRLSNLKWLVVEGNGFSRNEYRELANSRELKSLEKISVSDQVVFLEALKEADERARASGRTLPLPNLKQVNETRIERNSPNHTSWERRSERATESGTHRR